MSNDLKKLLERVHEEITIFDYNSAQVPCIVMPEKKFNEIMLKIAGKPVSVDTNLNILQDGLGHVFVEITLDFSCGNIHENILLNANNSTSFFDALANTGMLSLSSTSTGMGTENIFMIQLPRPEKAVIAYDIIIKGLEAGNNQNPHNKK